MKKMMAILLVIGMTAALSGGCSGKEPEAPAPAQDQEETDAKTEDSGTEPEEVINLKLGSTTSEGTAEIEACHRFAERLEELSGGTMTCDILANGLAGSETEIVEGQQMGSLDMSVMCGVLQNFDSALMFLEWDFLFVNQEHLEEILYGEVGDRIEQRILDTTGIRVLDVFMRTPRLMSTTKKIELSLIHI